VKLSHLQVAVPTGALVLDFVFSDGGGTWDNNHKNDYHVVVQGAAERVDAMKQSRMEHLFESTFDTLKVRRPVNPLPTRIRNVALSLLTKAASSLRASRTKGRVALTDEGAPGC
jgi:hypothetical protein